ncbi:hypothetical protein [Halomicrococcus sp. NG-SE-24]
MTRFTPAVNGGILSLIKDSKMERNDLLDEGVEAVLIGGFKVLLVK